MKAEKLRWIKLWESLNIIIDKLTEIWEKIDKLIIEKED